MHNLKSMGLGFRIFANDNLGKLPWQVDTNHGGSLGLTETDQIVHHFFVMSNELTTPKILICPADARKASTNWAGLSRTNLSYFLGLDARETYPQMFLAGDRNLSTNGVPAGPGLVHLTPDVEWGWTKAMHRGLGNVVLGDGSVPQMTGTQSTAPGARPDARGNRLLVP